MKSFLSTIVFLAVASSALACSGGAQEEAGNSEGAAYVNPAPSASASAASADVKAFLEKKPLKGTVGPVTVDATTVAVVTPSDLKIGEKISNQIPHKLEDLSVYTDSGKVSGEPTPGLNDSNVLSLTYSIDIDGIAHPELLTFNFDLKTGARLLLSDVLTPEGVKAVVSECEAYMKADPERQGLETYCASSAKPGEGYGGAPVPVDFTITAKGITFMPHDMPGAAFVFFVEGVEVPWAKLKGQISNASVKALAEKAR